MKNIKNHDKAKKYELFESVLNEIEILNKNM
jgi:hypothetical protein